MSESVTIVCGATGGIGTQVCRDLFNKNKKIVLVARNENKLKLLSEELGDSMYFSGDLTEELFFDNIIEEVLRKYDSIEGFVYCVGSIFLKPLHLMTYDEWKKLIDINLNSLFLSLKSVIKAMMKNKNGSIVVFSSVAAETGMINHSGISAVKSGVEGLVRSTAITYANRGIRINCIAPGLVETPLSAFLLNSEINRKISENMHPIGRIGNPKDISNAVIFLLDSSNSWITGQVIGIDGGMGIARIPSKM